MRKSWGKAATIGAGALALLMGAGIWRSTLQAGETPRAIAASAPRADAAEGGESTREAETPGATAGAGSQATETNGDTPVSDATGETPAGKGGAQAEFEALMTRLRQKAKSATEPAAKQALLTELVGELHKFSETHPGDPVSDQAQMAVGQLQIRSGNAAEAVVTFRGVAERGADPQVKRPAVFMLAQALAMAGQMDLAKAKLAELSPLATSGKSAQEKEVGKASKELLAQLNNENGVKAGAKPPAFTAKDVTGAAHSIEQYRGKVLLIDFWATWCGPCRAELPAVKAVYNKYRDQGLVVLGVSLDEDRSAMDRFVKSEGMEWPQLFDGKGWKNEIVQLYGVTGIPRAILIDREGVVRHAAIRGHELDAAVGELLK